MKIARKPPKGIQGFQKGHPPYNFGKGCFKRGYNPSPKTEFKKGATPWNKNTKGLIKPNSGNFKKGHVPINGFKKGQVPWNKNIRIDRKLYPKMGNWKGGISPLASSIRELPEYFAWRNKILKQNNYTCQRCWTRNKLQVHHHLETFKELFAKFLEKYNQFSPVEDKETLLRLAIKYKPFWNTKYGKTICMKCHNQIERVIILNNG